ncbi:tripartite tricarboxylate transporter substrate binding protein [Siccirubricoccus sp. KC 17139]|uniref:Tripartite tricarboxylate transporter substrate binding protein n=1 Tax=Siccirubricoccus soli TaxID=2899147 RepID=A0ABT1D690_9PROT|nr:tripartite tricarboxylate transporter substrate binding protein [Siccirubricoccus soli]MCO6417444.1 tripartite tricarboxylate transporter substrate binding protein [Siccirubricoccus soli]MCP2683579.1 tripartite tricarboxylate transporter substrate binding protein [Siccirubricoccus soli]
MQAFPGRRALGAAALAALAQPGLAQNEAAAWPNRPVRLIVGYPAGGSTDICARILAEDFRTRLPQPVLVENRTGANGSLGAAFVAAATDGHALLVSNTSTMTVNHLLYRDTRYHPLRDLLPIATITISPFILVINPRNPRTQGVRSLAELVALARRQPGRISYASAGVGNLQHLHMEQLLAAAGAQMLHVPYRGSSLATNALVAGEVDVLLDTPTTAGPLLQAGTFLALATTGDARWRELPEVPTVKEAGYPEFSAVFWNGLVAPAGTPPELVQRLYAMMEAVAESPTARPPLLAQGDIFVLDPARFRARIAEDIERNAAAIKAAGIEMQ